MRLPGRAIPIRRHVQRTVVVALVLFCIIAAVAVGALWRERQLTLAQAREDAEMLSAVMEESTARTFDSVDIALAGLAQHFAGSHAARHDAATRDLMRAQLRQLPTVRALFVVGPDGFLRHDTDDPATRNVSLGDRPYFRPFLEQASLARHLSKPLQSRSGLGWFVAASHRITRPDGSFGGVLVAAVQLDTVARLYRKLGLGHGRQMALFRRDGVLLARYPDDGNTGRSYAHLPVFAHLLPFAGVGVIETDGAPYSDVQRVLSYRALESQPLVVLVAIRRDVALAAWSRAAAGTGAGLLLLALLTVGGVLFYEQRQVDRGRARAHRVAAAEAAALADRMRKLAAELTQADARKTEFLATLSHELRNVLAPIQNGLAILGRVDPASYQARRAREIVQTQVVQMRHLVDDLLDIARVNSGKVLLDLQPRDLRDIAAEACAAAQAALDAARHTLTLELAEAPVWVVADHARLLQVLANLLGNAAKYTPAGTGRIAVAVRAQGERATIEVRDNGLGIPPEELAKVFGMFEQVGRHRAQSQGGLGIGLALVARLVALHGGEVAAHSEGDGTGSTFTVSLPLVAAGPPAVTTQPVGERDRSTV
jgi:signal transduction histidine kinase